VSYQTLDHAASNVVHQRVRLGRDATARIGEVGLGADLGRLDLGISLEGDGCSSEVVGLYFGEGSQTLDYRLVVNHSGRSTSSDVFLKGALEDDAQSVFTGLLRIEKDAQKTSTFETNRNLVLSENAKAHSVPNLEILCDDVVCGHGSSVGPLEEDHLYYLQSRGLRRERAERLLIRGFFTEVIDRLPIQGLAAPVSDEVFRRFLHAQDTGGKAA
jgi:Fe-S cluster assembly protein SufD